jgi:hypothetical protein
MAKISINGQRIERGGDLIGYLEGAVIKDKGGSKIGYYEGSRIYNTAGAIASVDGSTLTPHEKRRTYKNGSPTLPLTEADKDLSDTSLAPVLKGALYEFFINPA